MEGMSSAALAYLGAGLGAGLALIGVGLGIGASWVIDKVSEFATIVKPFSV